MLCWISPSRRAELSKVAHKTDYGRYPGHAADPDSRPWEVVVASNIEKTVPCNCWTN